MSAYKYGEFIPFNLSYYAYNETLAQEFGPLIISVAFDNGYRWRDSEAKNFNVTIDANHIPDDIKNVDEKILDEILECADKGKCHHRCTGVFRITQSELQFYKKQFIPLPNKCPNCRYHDRFSKIPLPHHLYHRTCMCKKTNHPIHLDIGCPSEFETSYSPDRPETVYCEKCYQQEVY